jgi:hypothetical protein
MHVEFQEIKKEKQTYSPNTHFREIWKYLRDIVNSRFLEPHISMNRTTEVLKTTYTTTWQ